MIHTPLCQATHQTIFQLDQVNYINADGWYEALNCDHFDYTG